MSAPHIYHSALPLSPRTSLIHKTYKNYASPLVRVVQGIPDSWERVVATATFDKDLWDVVWSPCNRFIAVAKFQSVEVLDAVTLSRLSIFKKLPYRTLLQSLSFSPDGRCLTVCDDGTLTSWDLQTGSPLSPIFLELKHSNNKPFSFKHSKDGKMIAVAYKPRGDYGSDIGYSSSIYTYDYHSERHVGSHCFPEERIINPIWTQDEYLQFATIGPKSIKIWQSPFTLEPPPVEVASFPVPDGITDANRLLFLPSLSRLAFVLEDEIQVWDVKAPKLLLKSKLTPSIDETSPPQSSFSSDGRFFAFTTSGEGVHVWKESPTGYLPHQQLPFFADFSKVAPRFSPNAESIIVSLQTKIHRLHARDQVPSLPSVSTRGSDTSDFTLGFSPGENLAAFARRGGNTVTIIDLKSGEHKWNINMGVEISCVGMAGGTVIVVGEGSIVTRNLPGGDRIIDTSINNIVRATIHYPSSLSDDSSSLSDDPGPPYCMSISPDLNRVVVMRTRNVSAGRLEVVDVSTGSRLATSDTMAQLRPRFTRDGCEVWVGNYGEENRGEEFKIIEDNESGAIRLKRQSQEQPFPESSSGYTVSDGGWILSPSQKRLLWLPHRLRSGELDRAWGGQFLGLLDGELSEVVILELLE